MSITRAFTSRRVKQSLELRDAAEGVVSRGNTHKSSPSLGSIRNKISAPVQLISTTNMLSYNAPDIRPKINSAASTNSSKTESDSDSAPSLESPGSTPPTSPDSPFINIAKRPSSPEPNHLSCYFAPPGQAANAPAPAQAPVIPTRAPSHTKKNFDILTRHKSSSRLSEQSGRTVSSKGSFSFSRSSSTSTNTTTTSQSASFSNSKAPLPPITQTPLPAPPSPPRAQRKEPSAASPGHPFGNELARVTELAEEFGGKAVSSQVLRQEETELLNKGYKKFNPDSYVDDVQGLYSDFFAEDKATRPLWI
ncbi:hypothetical protein GGTG_01894 [Gaeumannomyces tritici R3-111a-1]|uniref:Uncharacterized protein n=1 Tax=Gaeumannomyces tritici (strain R3-111a-1) TaxID=644352 RepID=J3NKV3_GAET3|nr:hypothetical protein GGTG_01894 [Gaeumannomyces tritici R3-111a-1]EJT81920.1 hypothetical protein GGTG_01894 [Gaeumannomyces tritici R3-111a-1]